MNKRNYIVLDLLRSEKYGLNPTESILVSYLFGLISQYEPIPYNGKWYYMADYNYLIKNCPILPTKVDTLRRLYKRIENIGLIEIIKLDNHVCFSPSNDLREWGLSCESVEAEKNPVEAEKNPVEAEKNPVEAEKNPVTHYNNIIDSNIDSNIEPEKKISGLFPNEQQTEESRDKKTLFRNSDIYKLVRFENGVGVDYSEFENKFETPEFEKVDLVYYFHAVSDWSDQRGMKRTKNGWLATVRNFIRGDVEKKKLHLKPEYQAPQKRLNVAGAMEFLNNDY